jgi:hypothetical protein
MADLAGTMAIQELLGRQTPMAAQAVLELLLKAVAVVMRQASMLFLTQMAITY